MRALAIALVLTAFPKLPAVAQQFNAESLAPYIPTPQILVLTMLQAADVKPSDMVYDLGSGDGRIVITAAKVFGAHAVGVELRPDLCREAQQRIRTEGVEGRVRIIPGNFLRVDLSPATVVTMYLLTSSNERLRPNLEKYLRPGARVVSNDYPIKGWRESRLRIVKTGAAEHKIYVYEMGHTK
ncbi:MAG: methyltransferase domain-containing protein [Acidobacteriia bacterium]|nr:methyltransferase domain-containing protein [Terriglobia bacterium]